MIIFLILFVGIIIYAFIVCGGFLILGMVFVGFIIVEMTKRFIEWRDKQEMEENKENSDNFN